MDSTKGNDRSSFESAIQGLEAEIANIGVHLTVDAAVRQAYSRKIREMANELRVQANSGNITWKQAASQAQEMRNSIMDILRGRSTPVGRAVAESLKREGKSLNELIARKTRQLFGSQADFTRLSSAQQNQVYANIVKSAGKPNPKMNALMRGASRAGRSLIILSIALSVYTIASAEDKVGETKRELAVTGSGIAGGIAGGAAAGLICGPGAPVCVTAGAFIGGALAAFGVDYFW